MLVDFEVFLLIVSFLVQSNLQKVQETASDIFYTTFEVDFTEIL